MTIRALLLIAAVTYAGVPWEAVVGFPLDPSSSYLSELAAADQPYGLLFRALDASTGALVFGALALRSRTGSSSSRFARGAVVALAVFSGLTILDASSPMACATSTSDRCAAADAANTLGLAHQIHSVSSAGALVAVVASGVLLAFAVASDRTRFRPIGREMVFAIVGALIAATVLVTVLAMLSAGEGKLLDGGGFAQRAQVLLISAYLVVFGVIATQHWVGSDRESGTTIGGLR